jgi:murein peptide amidase A
MPDQEAKTLRDLVYYRPRQGMSLLLGVLAIVLSAACSTLDGERASRIERIEDELLGMPDEDPRFKASAIGEVDYRGLRYPILAVEYRPPGGAAHYVLNIGGIHGDEAGGVEAVYRMILECRTGKASAIGMDFILCANPWGYRFDKRGNRDGIDLNRDFRALASQEAKIVDAYLKGRKYDLVIDHHENKYANGYSIICHDEEERPLVRAIIDGLPGYGVATKTQKVENYERGITIMGLGEGKAFSQYAGLRHSSSKRSFVIETPTDWDMEKRIQCHLDIERKLEAALMTAMSPIGNTSLACRQKIKPISAVHCPM